MLAVMKKYAFKWALDDKLQGLGGRCIGVHSKSCVHSESKRLPKIEIIGSQANLVKYALTSIYVHIKIESKLEHI
jgi:hypothetical protein